MTTCVEALDELEVSFERVRRHYAVTDRDWLRAVTSIDTPPDPAGHRRWPQPMLDVAARTAWFVQAFTAQIGPQVVAEFARAIERLRYGAEGWGAVFDRLRRYAPGRAAPPELALEGDALAQFVRAQIGRASQASGPRRGGLARAWDGEQAYHARVTQMVSEGDLDDAGEELEEALRIHGDSAMLWAQRGRLWDRVGQPYRAAKAFERSLQLDPTNAVALDAFVERARQGGDPSAHMHWLERKLTAHPTDAEAFAKRAMDRRFTGRLREAAADAILAIAFAPRHWAEPYHAALRGMVRAWLEAEGNGGRWLLSDIRRRAATLPVPDAVAEHIETTARQVLARIEVEADIDPDPTP